MNTNSVVKFFTLVSFFVVTGFGLSVFAKETQEQCVSRIARAKKQACSTETDPEKKQACLSIASTEAADDPECSGLDSKSDSESNDNECKSAYDDYNKNKADADSACESLTSSSTSSSKKSCSAKIAECSKVASDTSSSTVDPNDRIGAALSLFNAFTDESSDSCLIDVDSEKAAQAEKEFRDRRKELADEKKKIEDDAIQDKEDHDKEITRITKEIQELQRTNKETLAKADTKMREELNQAQKDMVDSAARLRNINTQLSKKSDSLRALNFAYTDMMMDKTVEKQNLRCKAALDQAKGCMIKSAKGIKDESCKDFPFVINSKGPKATAELKAQLQKVADLCYEKESREKKKAEFDQQEQIKKVSDEMNELQAQAKEEGQRQQIQSENSQKIQQEAEREKQEAQANLADQISTLQGEMAQFAQKLAAKTQKTQERLQENAKKLQELELEEKTGKRSKTSLASRAVRETNARLDSAKASCDCKDDLSGSHSGSKKQDTICKAIKKSLPSGSSRKSRSSSKSGSAY